MPNETIFTLDTSSIKFGPGATREVGEDMRALGAQRVMLVTDPRLAKSEPVAVTLDALRASGIDAVVFDQVRVEPTDASFQEAIRFATDGRFDGFVAVVDLDEHPLPSARPPQAEASVELVARQHEGQVVPT